MSPNSKYDQCPNCGQKLRPDDKYCPNCGQKNRDWNISLWQLIIDFLGDYFSFDSKLFKSLKPLLFKPGSMTRAYNEGRRQRYIPPLRLFIFLSIIFFFILSLDIGNPSPPSMLPVKSSTEQDTFNFRKVTIGNIHLNIHVSDTSDDFLSRVHYLSRFYTPEQVADSTSANAGFFAKTMLKQYVKLVQSQGIELVKYIIQNGTIIILLVMPLFALLVKLLYWKSDKLYLHHFIFSLHVHSFFIVLLILMQLLHLFFNWYYFTPMVIIMAVYCFFALRTNYQQKNKTTILKEVILGLSYLLLLNPVVILAFFISFLLF